MQYIITTVTSFTFCQLLYSDFCSSLHMYIIYSIDEHKVLPCFHLFDFGRMRFQGRQVIS